MDPSPPRPSLRSQGLPTLSTEVAVPGDKDLELGGLFPKSLAPSAVSDGHEEPEAVSRGRPLGE